MKCHKNVHINMIQRKYGTFPRTQFKKTFDKLSSFFKHIIKNKGYSIKKSMGSKFSIVDFGIKDNILKRVLERSG